MEFDRERERSIQVADWKGLKDRGGKLAEKNRRAKKRLASNKAGERVGREMDGRLKGSEKVWKGRWSPRSSERKIIKLLIGGRLPAVRRTARILFRNFRFKEKEEIQIFKLDTSFRIDRRIEGGERERESRSKSRSQNAEIAKDSRGGRGGWTVRFLLVRLRLCRRTKLCGQWRNAAEPLLETRYMHGAPRRYKGAPTPANPPSILSIAVPVASVTQLPDGSNYVVAVRSHPPPHHHTSLYLPRSNFVLFGSAHLR